MTILHPVICSKCGRTPSDTVFRVRKDSNTGYRGACKECEGIYKKLYYMGNRAAYNERKKKWRSDNQTSFMSRAEDYRNRNREAIRRVNAEYKKKNPAIVAAVRLNRRARKAETVGSISSDVVTVLLSEQGGLCPVCLVDLSFSGYHADHVMPLALGGMNTDINIQLLCPSCNTRKGSKHPVDFFKSVGIL